VAQAESMRSDSQFFSFEEALEAALNICKVQHRAKK
jgi:hypothetical protein